MSHSVTGHEHRRVSMFSSYETYACVACLIRLLTRPVGTEATLVGSSCMERFIPLGSRCVGVLFQLQSSWTHVRIKSVLGFHCSQVNVSESRSALFACRPGFIYAPLLRGTAAGWAFADVTLLSGSPNLLQLDFTCWLRTGM